MATSITKQITIDYGNASDWLTADGVSLNTNAFGVTAAFRLYMNGATTGHAVLNAAAMEALFPTPTSRPYQLDHTMYVGRLTKNSSNYCALQFDGVDVHKATDLKSMAGTEFTLNAITDSAVTASTRNSAIRYECHTNSTVNAVGAGDIVMTLYFWQYAFAAQVAGNGIKSASVSNSSPYEGDSVTYTVTLKPGATWNGWYSDAECTQLVSTEQSYTVVAGADTTLYASATVEYGAGLYVRDGGAYAEVRAAYKKANGVYVQQDDVSGLLDTSIKYIRGT